MTTRLDARNYLTSDAGQALLNLGRAADAGRLERSLLKLVKVRASQINGWISA